MASPFTLGQTDVTLYFKAWNIADGTPNFSLAYDSTGLIIGYIRERAAAVTAEEGGSPAPVTQTATGAHTDWGFVQVSSNLYRVDFPDAAFVSSGSPKFVIPFVSMDDDSVAFILESGNDLTAGDPRAATVNADVVSISGDSTAADNAELFFDGTGYAGGTTKLQVNAVQVGSQTASASGTVTFPNATLASTTNITAAAGVAVSSIGANVITATSIASDAITAAKIADGAIDAATFAAGAITASAIAADAIGASELASDAVTEIATGVWASGTRVLTAGTNIALAKGTGVTGFTDLSASDVRTAVGLASANLDTQLSAIDTVVDAILVDTGTTLDAALAVVDGNVDAIKAKTDSLTFTETGIVDANVQMINDVAITGDGQEGTEFGV